MSRCWIAVLCTLCVNCYSSASRDHEPDHQPKHVAEPARCNAGPIEALAEIPASNGGPTAMALADDTIYLQMPARRGALADQQAARVWSVAASGGLLEPAPDADPAFAPVAEVTEGDITFRVDAGNIVRDDGTGQAMPIARIDHSEGDCIGMAADDDELFFTLESGWLWSVAKLPDSTPIQRFLGGPTDCDDDYNGLMVAADANYVYWVSGTMPDHKTSDGKPLQLYRACTH